MLHVDDSGFVDPFYLALDLREFLEEASEGFARSLFQCQQVLRILWLCVVSLEIVTHQVSQLLPGVDRPGGDEKPHQGRAIEGEGDTLGLGGVVPLVASIVVS